MPPPSPAPANATADQGSAGGNGCARADGGAAAPASAPAGAKPEGAPGFSVQLAAFADDKGANALSNKLKKAGYPAYTEPLTTSKGTLVARARRAVRVARCGGDRRATS